LYFYFHKCIWNTCSALTPHPLSFHPCSVNFKPIPLQENIVISTLEVNKFKCRGSVTQPRSCRWAGSPIRHSKHRMEEGRGLPKNGRAYRYLGFWRCGPGHAEKPSSHWPLTSYASLPDTKRWCFFTHEKCLSFDSLKSSGIFLSPKTLWFGYSPWNAHSWRNSDKVQAREGLEFCLVEVSDFSVPLQMWQTRVVYFTAQRLMEKPQVFKVSLYQLLVHSQREAWILGWWHDSAGPLAGSQTVQTEVDGGWTWKSPWGWDRFLDYSEWTA
jgi:hypothetical protein